MSLSKGKIFLGLTNSKGITMSKLFFTLLVIEYVVHDTPVSTSVIFPSQKECYDAMSDGALDNLYDILADTYGKEIMMYCKKTPFTSGVSVPSVKPEPRPTS
tara:strand:+ start:453 stop:758 length:306 start_codon:yes stop_codon:yes gene_type:complete